MEISAIAVRPEAPGGAATARLSRSLWHERHLLGMKCRFCMYTRTIRLHRSMPGWASASAASSGCPCGAGLRRPDRMSAITRFVLRETSAAVGLLFRCFSYMSTQPNEIILGTPKSKLRHCRGFGSPCQLVHHIVGQLCFGDSEAQRHSKRSDPSLGSGPEDRTVEPQACRDA